MSTEQELIERLRRIETLFAGTEFDGERDAAAAAMNRIRDRLRQHQEADPPVEYRFSLGDGWSVRLFTALLRRYGLKPFRFRGQRRTTVMARVSKSFVDKTLWPEYMEIQTTLSRYLDEVTNRVISECINRDVSDADVVDAPGALGM
ncbi:MAG: hypothetical protein IPK83_23755 [Planctomycetes bacterium]|nr:hypothetical protein [Planctomycetota bacterium]